MIICLKSWGLFKEDIIEEPKELGIKDIRGDESQFIL
jgi:hypothetical protein